MSERFERAFFREYMSASDTGSGAESCERSIYCAVTLGRKILDFFPGDRLLRFLWGDGSFRCKTGRFRSRNP